MDLKKLFEGKKTLVMLAFLVGTISVAWAQGDIGTWSALWSAIVSAAAGAWKLGHNRKEAAVKEGNEIATATKVAIEKLLAATVEDE